MSRPVLPYKALLIDPRTGLLSQAWLEFLRTLGIHFVGLDTSTAAQTVDLATLDATAIVIKDETGFASVNPITVLGTVDGVLNPTITADYGVLRVYANNRVWQTW